MYSRVIISQDRHRIYFTVAEYPQKYIDYLRNKRAIDINNEDCFLRMRLFGYFDIRDSSHMKLLGVLVNVILTHAADEVHAASTMVDLEQDFKSISISKSKERTSDDPQTESSGQSRRAAGGMVSRSPSRSGSPNAELTIKDRSALADSEV